MKFQQYLLPKNNEYTIHLSFKSNMATKFKYRIKPTNFYAILVEKGGTNNHEDY